MFVIFPVCVDTYTEVVSRFAPGGERETTADSVQECIDACNAKARDECTAFDFNAADNGCWLHSAANPNIQSTTLQITHYQRVECTREFSL